MLIYSVENQSAVRLGIIGSEAVHICVTKPKHSLSCNAVGEAVYGAYSLGKGTLIKELVKLTVA